MGSNIGHGIAAAGFAISGALYASSGHFVTGNAIVIFAVLCACCLKSYDRGGPTP